ncbi:hypothetical protein GCM10023153_14630 [Ornithinibacter aureus]|uniref:Uncharacterized protein n=1 Tax=Ornithinibacter aureus TaxID=622664 RepID=A0ABP8JQ29_9MICO
MPIEVPMMTAKSGAVRYWVMLAGPPTGLRWAMSIDTTARPRAASNPSSLLGRGAVTLAVVDMRQSAGRE